MRAMIQKPVIFKIDDNEAALKKLEEELQKNPALERKRELILEYPIVYIHNWKSAKDYEVYIGESANVLQRTRKHYGSAEDSGNWRHQLLKNKAGLYIIGHEHFNKSLTLDVENRLMHYMMSVSCVKKIHNHRGNPQKKYYPEYELDGIFQEIWKALRAKDRELFPPESAVRDSAVFKASPLHKLTQEQENAKELIIRRVMDALHGSKEKQLIYIEGEAGTGKTVLNSSTFYELYSRAEKMGMDQLKCCLMVNHKEQITVYEQICMKLGLTDRYGKIVYKPTVFINHFDPKQPIDVAFIDEAHLLLTQGKQSYKGRNQLQDIIDRARVTVVMFDENQILTTEQFWEARILEHFKNLAKQSDNYMELKNQMRMSANKDTLEWIDAFTKNRKINPIPKDPAGYEIRIFEQPGDMEEAIKNKAQSKESVLSRMVATYDWEYNSKRSPENRLQKYWEVMIGQWHKPWNYELEKEFDRNEKKKIKSLSWAKQPHTVNEIGSTFTIQGFDLNYVGVILGPSVKYRNREIIFDPNSSHNDKAVRNRTLSDGSKQKFGELLIQHEVRVLMTRGVNGLYIYAYDPELRTALQSAAAGRGN